GKSGNVAMSLPRMALALVNCVPASCIPSPESPANRIVTESSSWTWCRWPGIVSAVGLDTVMSAITSMIPRGPAVPSRPFRLPRHDGRVRGQVINRRGEMFDQVVHDPLDRQHADRPARFVHHG